MKKERLTLNARLTAIALAAFVPMTIVLIYALLSLSSVTNTYLKITQSVTYANQTMDFKERMDYSMYLAVIEMKDFEELGQGEITVNGIVTVNPYESIEEMKLHCQKLSEMATVDINRNQVVRLNNTLVSLEDNIRTLEKMIAGEGTYEENMLYLDENIYMLTSMIHDGILEYIRVETTNLQEVGEQIESHNKQVYSICVLMAIVAVFFTLILTVKALQSVTKPIRRLCSMTEKVANGDFSVRSEEKGIAEIAVLTRSFNDMTTEIGDLVEDIKEQQKSLHLMETKLLQAQINPHFLYNTLDTIVWLAEENQSEQVVTLVTTLSDFFRTTLNKGWDFVTVQEEKQHIESYLKIQQFRYQDIMDYEIEIDESMFEYTIPKLLLQPLVENALYHGVKTKRGKSTIRITGEKKGENLIFIVCDNGKGMTEETLKKLRENIQKDSNERKMNSFGLANINSRIKHYYGEEYGLYIESEENVGTEATVVIRKYVEMQK